MIETRMRRYNTGEYELYIGVDGRWKHRFVIGRNSSGRWLVRTGPAWATIPVVYPNRNKLVNSLIRTLKGS